MSGETCFGLCVDKHVKVLYYYVMEQVVLVYQNAKRKVQLGYLVGAVALANQPQQRNVYIHICAHVHWYYC